MLHHGCKHTHIFIATTIISSSLFPYISHPLCCKLIQAKSHLGFSHILSSRPSLLSQTLDPDNSLWCSRRIMILNACIANNIHNFFFHLQPSQPSWVHIVWFDHHPLPLVTTISQHWTTVISPSEDSDRFISPCLPPISFHETQRFYVDYLICYGFSIISSMWVTCPAMDLLFVSISSIVFVQTILFRQLNDFPFLFPQSRTIIYLLFAIKASTLSLLYKP